MRQPVLFKGALSVDDRGEVGFVNEFSFKGVKRFYTIGNHREGFIRAWHGHRHEEKYFTVVQGSALLCGVEVDDWEHPSKDLQVHRFVLSDRNPAVLHFPSGYANGFISLTRDTKIIVFSTSTVEESQNDDVRFPSRYWDPWTIQER